MTNATEAKKQCGCLQCTITRTVQQFTADNPHITPGDISDGLACVLSHEIGVVFNVTKDAPLIFKLADRAMKTLGRAIEKTTHGKLQVNAGGDQKPGARGEMH